MMDADLEQVEETLLASRRDLEDLGRIASNFMQAGIASAVAIAGDDETDRLLGTIAAEHDNPRLAELAAAQLEARQAAAS